MSGCCASAGDHYHSCRGLVAVDVHRPNCITVGGTDLTVIEAGRLIQDLTAATEVAEWLPDGMLCAPE